MVVLQRKTIRAVARHGENGLVTHVLSISRQGFHHSHLTLVAGNAQQTRRQSTINAAETTMDPQAVLKLIRGVMHESYNSSDSVCKSLQTPSPCTAAICLAILHTSLPHGPMPYLVDEVCAIFFFCLFCLSGTDSARTLHVALTRSLILLLLTDVPLCTGWGQTIVGMSAARPNSASTVSTAFVTRKVHTIAIGGPGRRSMWQRMGLEPTTLSLPVFQYYPEDKACSVWLYETDKSTVPHQKLTWFGVKSLADGEKVLEGNQVSFLSYYMCLLLHKLI